MIRCWSGRSASNPNRVCRMLWMCSELSLTGLGTLSGCLSALGREDLDREFELALEHIRFPLCTPDVRADVVLRGGEQ